jgi:hypothetical protein
MASHRPRVMSRATRRSFLYAHGVVDGYVDTTRAPPHLLDAKALTQNALMDLVQDAIDLVDMGDFNSSLNNKIAKQSQRSS